MAADQDESRRRLPTDFAQSYLNYEDYPENLTYLGRHRSMHSSRMKFYKDHLATAGGRLFEQDAAANVTFRDTGHNEHIVRTVADLEKWLGLSTEFENRFQRRIWKVERQDPKTRFVYISSDDSGARLNITKEILARIFTLHQVMPEYLDLISIFGEYFDQRRKYVSGFFEQNNIQPSSETAAMAVTALNRSGRHYRLCWNLKCVKNINQRRGHNLEADERTAAKWEIRQAAFYHQFDVVKGTALWIVTKEGGSHRQLYKDMTNSGATGNSGGVESPTHGFRSSLDVHLMFCYWALADWAGYVHWLDDQLESKNDRAATESQTDRAVTEIHGGDERRYDFADVESMQLQEERAQLAVAVIQSNVEVMELVIKFYQDLVLNEHFIQGQEVEDLILDFASETKGVQRTMQQHASRVESLAKMIRDRRELMAQDIQIQASKRMETLTINMDQSTKRMEELSKSMEKETIVVRIITIVTLFYLPGTFVSTFFSTEVIKYRDKDGVEGGESFSYIALMRWLQVTLPLTFVTLVFAWYARKFAEERNESRRKQPASTPHTESRYVERLREPQQRIPLRAPAQHHRQVRSGDHGWEHV